MRTLGVELAAMLADRGVDVVFGIPGVHNIEMYRGIEDSGITHVLARHEQGAGFMADGYARATDKPGVCFVISGPGVTNIMTPMGQANSDSVPLLVISTVLDETAARRGQLHQMRDQEGAARTVCDWSETARTPKAAYALVDRALTEFSIARPRPKHISIPIATLGGPAESFRPASAAPVRPMFPDAELDALAGDLDKANRPLFIFGGGARKVAARELLRATGAASFTTYAGGGIVPPDAPLYFGSYLARASSAEVIESADLVIAVGTELAEVDLLRSRLAESARMIRVDIDPVSLTDGHIAKHSFNIDATTFAEAVGSLSDAGRITPATGWTMEEVRAARTRWRAEVDAMYPGISPICDALRDALPAETMIYSDMTQFAYAAKEVWDLPAPGLWHHPYGFGTLGYALPAAIGGQVARPGKPTMVVVGDYGIQYTIQEIGTMCELRQSIPILLWDNDALAEIRDCMVEAQIAPTAVTLRNPKWDALAEAYDCAYAEPDTIEALCETVNNAFKAGKPTLIRAIASRLAG